MPFAVFCGARIRMIAWVSFGGRAPGLQFIVG